MKKIMKVKVLKLSNWITFPFFSKECCGGPRLVDIQSSTTDRILYTGIIDSDTDVFLQNPSNTEEKILTYKLDVVRLNTLPVPSSYWFSPRVNIIFLYL